ncbi:MAG: ABC transporter permease [Clostridiales bacterium]|nr:ABC transporter permease [Clostridiales bacterium]
MVRVVKKKELSSLQAVLLRVAAVVLAFAAGGLFLLAIGQNPFDVYWKMLTGSLQTSMALQATVKIGIPLLINALGVTLAFKMKFWNIGAEGQMIFGAICATFFALYCSGWPHYLLLLAAFLAGAVGGGLWGLIPAVFKCRWGTNETLFTLMLNYIALYLIDYLQKGPWQDPNSKGFPKIATFSDNVYIDTVFGIQAGWVIGLVLMAGIFVFLNYTKWGYEISVVGESQATARYAGINVRKVVLSTMFLSGAVCGIAGMVQAVGTTNSLTSGIAGGVGFTAIIVAWLAQLNPFGILLVTTLFSILEKGATVIQISHGVSAFASEVLQGIILFFILASEFFIRYSFALRKKGGAD